MKKSLFISAIALMFAFEASAQVYSGLLANQDGVTIGDIANLTQTQYQYGTARSMSMGGALSSVGADASVMATNPAGLGLYRRSELTFTPMITSQKSVNSAMDYQDNTRVPFNVANLSIVSSVNLANSGGGLLGLSFGIGYNRVADLNYNTSFFSSSMGARSSIAQFFSDQLNDSGVSLSQLQGEKNPNWNDSNLTTDIWGAVLGYKVGLADWSDGIGWNPGWIGDGADVGHFMNIQSKGRVDEFDFSMGANVGNKLYIGATLGVQTLVQRIYYDYTEDYLYDPNGIPNDYELNYAHYNQAIMMNGVGVNFKFGLIYRPVESLRLGVAVHTPTAFAVDREYQALAASSVRVYTDDPAPGINTDTNGNSSFGPETSPLLEDYGDYGWSFTAPTRMIFGASYAIGNRAILSFDYQRDWYNKMRMRSAPTGVDIYSYEQRTEIYYRATNTYKAGAEFWLMPSVALRLGYGLTDSMVASENFEYAPASPVAEKIQYFSAGLGFNFTKTFSMDLAYMHQTTKYTDFQLYGTYSAPIYSFDIVRQNFVVSTTLRF